jgi:toxin-antitoxin system PIN domain toxin
VKPYLLDVNVLIALAWPNHVHHREALEWFQRKASHAFRTCPLTQTGFVRISSNPAFTLHAATPGEALALLRKITALAGHEFWPDDLPVSDAFPDAMLLAGHRQITDAYLLALAAAHDGMVATLDRGIAPLAKHYSHRLEIVNG